MPDDKCKGGLARLDFLLLLLPAGEAVKRQRESESESERVRFLLLPSLSRLWGSHGFHGSHAAPA